MKSVQPEAPPRRACVDKPVVNAHKNSADNLTVISHLTQVNDDYHMIHLFVGNKKESLACGHECMINGR